jgi:hypothetical protein
MDQFRNENFTLGFMDSEIKKFCYYVIKNGILFKIVMQPSLFLGSKG